MRIILLFSLLFFACNSAKPSDTESNFSGVGTVCPEDGSCSLKIENNTSFILKEDETGQRYPVFSLDDSILITYKFIKDQIPGTADGFYEEHIMLQLKEDDLRLELRDEELAAVNLTFARLCYCKGANGYLPVKQGKLIISQIGKDRYRLSLEFNITEMPHLIDKIDEDFVIE